ncbi:type II toxin-antitoxin system ParD family antitoxin [Terrimonas sp. NA20]|uniref:Type II toxin-antitoxin system ParD family antitoxin n=1 Tax=Terrimonas ginsenosidimutans TaxID=2908004 RepID=A0ABS9KR55_9BACT|nr:type II toxin-antitoxin system ParD family antitoxin [Terrimonas ginsenosidimutans]MCG2614801.1 type II toxin-antitoxin system ParD family antitoxin [Terrimonas ginsenosidimutans]
MAKNTSILLGDYFENFISLEVKSGRYASASEVVRAALRLFEDEQNKKKNLIQELEKGEKSGMVKDFNAGKFLKSLHTKHKKNAVRDK